MSRRDPTIPVSLDQARSRSYASRGAAASQAQAGSLTVTVKQRDGKPLVGAVITLEIAGAAAGIADDRASWTR